MAQKNVEGKLRSAISESRDELWKTYNSEATRLKEMIVALSGENEVLQRKVHMTTYDVETLGENWDNFDLSWKMRKLQKEKLILSYQQLKPKKKRSK